LGTLRGPGREGYRHSEASKKLISLALKNIKVSESTRELKREALLGKVFDKERIENMRISNTFRKPVQITNTETGEVLPRRGKKKIKNFIDEIFLFFLTQVPLRGPHGKILLLLQMQGIIWEYLGLRLENIY